MAKRRDIELVLMGTGTSVGVPVAGCRCEVCTSENPRNHRLRTGVLVRAADGIFNIDASPELRLQLVREKVSELHAALFTHAHADHIYGLDDLRIFGHRQDIDIPLYCEEDVEQQLRRAFHYAFAPPNPDNHRFATPRFRFERIGTEPFDLFGLRIQPIRLIHGRLPVLGFRMGDVAFCTDVSEIPAESWQHLEGLQTLILGALREEPHETHFSVPQALEVVEKVRPVKTYLTHIGHSLEIEKTNGRLPESVELAFDGLTIPIMQSG